MAQRPVSYEQWLEAEELLARHGTISELARRTGLSWSTWNNRLTRGRILYNDRKPASGTDQRPEVVVKPTYRIAQYRPDGKAKTRVIAIGDAHDSARIPKDRFRWIGRYIADIKPDMVIQIGDFCTMDSLCSYEKNDTIKGKAKPSFKEDMASFREALATLADAIGSHIPDCHVTLGNHEDRVFSFMNRTPEVAAMLDENLFTILGEAGWNYSPYGVLHFVGGVAFTHCPLNTMGKPYGGMYAENQISRDSLHDMVWGHTHKRVDRTYPKLNGQRMHVLNLGCALPEGHVEEYAQHALTGWSWGIYDLTILGGHIHETQWIPMPVLQERYE